MPQIREVDRNRFRPAEQYAAAAEELGEREQCERQGNRAHRVDVPDRIEADAPCSIRRHVTEAHRDVAVCGFVQRDREYDRYRVNRDHLDYVQIHWER